MHRMMRIQEVADLLGVCKNTIHNLSAKDDTFPRKIRLTPRRVVFRHDDVMSWLEGR